MPFFPILFILFTFPLINMPKTLRQHAQDDLEIAKNGKRPRRMVWYSPRCTPYAEMEDPCLVFFYSLPTYDGACGDAEYFIFDSKSLSDEMLEKVVKLFSPERNFVDPMEIFNFLCIFEATGHTFREAIEVDENDSELIKFIKLNIDDAFKFCFSDDDAIVEKKFGRRFYCVRGGNSLV